MFSHGRSYIDPVQLHAKSNLSIEDVKSSKALTTRELEYLRLTDPKVHINPHYMLSYLNLPRYQPHTWFNFSKTTSGTMFKKKVAFLNNKVSFEREIMRYTFQKPPTSNAINILFLGDYKDIDVYIQQVLTSTDQSVINTTQTLQWRAICPDPYLSQTVSDEYNNYGSMSYARDSPWIVGPDDDGVVNESMIKWLVTQPVVSNFTFYTGSTLPEPAYGQDRVLKDLMHIIASMLAVEKGGRSVFKILWPVNNYMAGLIGFIFSLYDNVVITKRVEDAPDDATIYVLAHGRKGLSDSDVQFITSPANWDSILFYFSPIGTSLFQEFFESERPRVITHIKDLIAFWKR